MRTTRIFRYLALTLVLACLSAGAVNAQFTVNGLTYSPVSSTVYEGKYQNVRLIAADENLSGDIVIPEIPAVYDGWLFFRVTEIGGSNTTPFANCNFITSVTIPNSVTSIDSWTFRGCTGLTAIYVDSNHPNYLSENGVLFNKDKTTLMCFPVGKTTYAVPNGVITIGEQAFNYCAGLTSITIPNSVTSINEDSNTFYGCTNLMAINVESNNQNYSSESGVLFNKNKTTLIRYPEGKTGAYTVPASVTAIYDLAFYDCINLTSIIIPNGVTGIGAKALHACTNLTSLTIPSSVADISFSAFSECTGLNQIHNQRTTPQIVEEYLFYDVNIQNITLYVPLGSLSAYRNAAVWKDFTNIVEENSTGVETVSAHSPALYPNPVTNGQLTIENGQLNSVVQIYDISGRMVETLHATSLRNGTQTINVSALPAGAYILKIGNYTERFVKK